MIDTHIHARTSEQRSLRWVLLINASFLIAELLGGIFGNSVALLADAGHLVTDVAAVSVALFAFWLSQQPGGLRHTYGYARAEVLAALANGLGLLIISAYVAYEAVTRLSEGPEVNGPLVLGVAVAGLIGNIVGVWLLHSHAGHSLNVRGAFLHLVGDSLASVAVVVSSILVMTLGWDMADPIAALIIAALILVAGTRLVLETVRVLMETVPRIVDIPSLEKQILDIPGVESAHDLHVWTVTSGCLAMSIHVQRSPDADAADLLTRIHRRMDQQLGVHHLTVQIENPDWECETVHEEEIAYHHHDH